MQQLRRGHVKSWWKKSHAPRQAVNLEKEKLWENLKVPVRDEKESKTTEDVEAEEDFEVNEGESLWEELLEMANFK